MYTLRSVDIPKTFPCTNEEYLRQLTPSQRLCLYEHVSARARESKQDEPISGEQFAFLTEDLVRKQKKGWDCEVSN